MKIGWKSAASQSVAAALIALGIGVAHAAEGTAPSAATPATTPAAGKLLFDRWCAECHAPGVGHPGTQQLGWTRGTKLAVLEQRADLTPEYIRYVVRNGLAAMPPYRPTEITDSELGQLAQYLAPPKRRR